MVLEILRDFGIKRPFYVKWPFYLSGIIFMTAFAAIVYLEMLHVEKRQSSLVVMKQGPSINPPTLAPSTGEFVESAARGEASKIVKRGDTLARLINEVYGRVDAKLIKLVKKANPTIDNENLIIEGRRIVFPTNKN